jgi:hypothetical protein
MNQGTEWGLLMKKNRSQKSRASVPLTLGSKFKLKSHKGSEASDFIPKFFIYIESAKLTLSLTAHLMLLIAGQ